MPKSVWVAVVALGYLLVQLAWKVVGLIQALPGIQTMKASAEAFAQGQAQWDYFFVKLSMLGIGGLIIWGLVKGEKIARILSCIIFIPAILLTAGGYFTGSVPPRMETLVNLFLYLSPFLAIIVFLSLTSARAYYNHNSWRAFRKWFGLGIVVIGLFFFSWMAWMLKLSTEIPVGK
jgi:hypothetical protein